MKTLLKTEVRCAVASACGAISQVDAAACPDIVNLRSLDLEALTAALNTRYITGETYTPPAGFEARRWDAGTSTPGGFNRDVRSAETPREKWLPQDLAELRELTRQINVLLDAPEAGLFSWWDSLRLRLEGIEAAARTALGRKV
jgi:hypothetical protein